MKTVIIIPAHNEEAFIGHCIESFISQSRRPDLLLIVDDNSTDHTSKVVERFLPDNPWIKLIHHISDASHQPGAKVVNAFNFGLTHLDQNYDLTGKFDADIVLPENYFSETIEEFEGFSTLGLCSGLLYIKNETGWVYENISDKSHVRGPVKLYRTECLQKMGGLRASIGWDTVDELLANYHGFESKTLKALKVKHLRPTGAAYDRNKARLRGEALYRMRYGTVLSLIATVKMALNNGGLAYFVQCMKGYIHARKSGTKPIVSPEEGKFIGNYRWKNIRKKLF